MNVLALKEEIILSSIWALGGESHGSLIRNKVIEFSNKEIVYGTLYNLLEVLIRKGHVASAKSEPTKVKGGKSKTIYSITLEGKKALQETKDLHENLWREMPDLGVNI